MIALALFGVLLAAGLFAAAACVPFWNRFFSIIWSDPTEREQEEIRRRLLELHVKNGLPPDTAAMLAAKEYHVDSEEAVLKAAQLLGSGGIKHLASGQNMWSRVAFGLTNALRRGMGR